MRIAFVDLVFSWPPNGGADVDLYHTIAGLQSAGHEVRLFVPSADTWERGAFDPVALPFPSTRIPFTRLGLRPGPVAQGLRDAVDAWRPEAVFIADGFFFKPALIEALAHYPCVGRFYAYEIACMRDLLLYKDGAPCPCNYLVTPDTCRACALEGMKDGIRRWRFLTWTHEYLAAGAFLPSYHARLAKALGKLRAAIVYNPLQAEHLRGYCDRVHVVPGGVNVADYESTPIPAKDASAKKVILMAGRVEDPMKGLAVLRAAGERLWRERQDFEIWATHTDRSLNSPWFKSIGWHTPAGLKAFYRDADICVVPSIWEEPFGLVAVEAMASGRPVCVSRVGGLQSIVAHGETGYVFERGDDAGLAAHLGELLDDAGLRDGMGRAGRQRAETEYDWDKIIARNYPAILGDLEP